MKSIITEKYLFAQKVAVEAGEIALSFYKKREQLTPEKKHHDGQDLVTIADKQVESYIREQIAAHYPEDSIFGEESGYTLVKEKYRWVIDPIDGTSAFVFGLASWCISIALLDEGKKTLVGVIYDPIHDELFHAEYRKGAFVNNTRVHVNNVSSLNAGLLGVGISTRMPANSLIPFLDNVLRSGGMFVRNGSAALMLAYVAAGKLIGYFEPHLNSWDCLAGILLIQEAGGETNAYFAKDDALMLGNYVLASGALIFDQLDAFRNNK